MEHSRRLRARPPIRKRIASAVTESDDTARRVVQAGDAAVVRRSGGVRGHVVEVVRAVFGGGVVGGVLVGGPAGGVVGGGGGLVVDGRCGGFGDWDSCQLVGKGGVFFSCVLTGACGGGGGGCERGGRGGYSCRGIDLC